MATGLTNGALALVLFLAALAKLTATKDLRETTVGVLARGSKTGIVGIGIVELVLATWLLVDPSALLLGAVAAFFALAGSLTALLSKPDSSSRPCGCFGAPARDDVRRPSRRLSPAFALCVIAGIDALIVSERVSVRGGLASGLLGVGLAGTVVGVYAGELRDSTRAYVATVHRSVRRIVCCLRSRSPERLRRRLERDPVWPALCNYVSTPAPRESWRDGCVDYLILTARSQWGEGELPTVIVSLPTVGAGGGFAIVDSSSRHILAQGSAKGVSVDCERWRDRRGDDEIDASKVADDCSA